MSRMLLVVYITMIMCLSIIVPGCGKGSSGPEKKTETATIFISSLPPEADMYADDAYVGKTNVAEIELNVGSHTMKFQKDSVAFDTTMSLMPGRNASIMIRLR